METENVIQRSHKSEALKQQENAAQSQLNGTGLSEAFSSILGQMMGQQGGFSGLNPLDLAPKPVGTEAVFEQSEETEVEVAEDELLIRDETPADDNGEAEEVEKEIQYQASEQEVVTEEVEQEVQEEEVVAVENEAIEQEFVEQVVQTLNTEDTESLEVLTDEVVEVTEEVAVSETDHSQGQVVEQEAAAREVEYGVRERVIRKDETGQTQEETGQKEVANTSHNKNVRHTEETTIDEFGQQMLKDEVGKQAVSKEAANAKAVTQKPEQGTEDRSRSFRMEQSLANANPETTVVDAALKETKVPKGPLQESFRSQMQALVRGAGVVDASLQASIAGSAGKGAHTGVSGVSGIGVDQSQSKSLARNAKQLQSTRSDRSPQEKVIEKVKELLKNASASKNGNTMVVRLDPPKLGSMTMRVTHRGGQVHARIIPDNAEVEATLRGRVSELVQVLASTGMNTENVHVSIGREQSETSMFQFNEFLGNGNTAQQNESGTSGRGSRDGDGEEALGANSELTNSQKIRGPNDAAGWVA